MIWTLHWEADLSHAAHRDLARLLVDIYPEHEATFRERSFYSARPEARIVGYDGERPIAHLGFIRRTLRAGAGGVLVGDVGLVGVAPAVRRAGLGRHLLAETAAVFDRLALPFGFLTCRPSVTRFYERSGWQTMPGQVTRMLDHRGVPEIYTGPALVLAVRAAIAAWPRAIVIRDGLEV